MIPGTVLAAVIGIAFMLIAWKLPDKICSTLFPGPVLLTGLVRYQLRSTNREETNSPMRPQNA
jgi:hypothetical protein